MMKTITMLYLGCGVLIRRIQFINLPHRGVSGRWAEWAIAHPGFCRIEGAAGQGQRSALLFAHLVLGSQLRPCLIVQLLKTSDRKSS